MGEVLFLGIHMTKNNHSNSIKGCTLVELSIVIVIIGFIVAGISAGSSLIKQAQIRSVITDFQNYQVSYNNFLGRYNAPPGDFASAASYWPAGTTGCATTGNVCNGNGDGIISLTSNGTNSTGLNESRLAWRQLAMAGMLNSGIAQINSNAQIGNEPARQGTFPTSKLSGAGYATAGYSADASQVLYNGTLAGTILGGGASLWQGTGKNSIYIGRSRDSLNGDDSGMLSNGALSSEDSFIIDQKIDDGGINALGLFTGANTGVLRTVNGDQISGPPDPTTTHCTGDATGFSTGWQQYYRVQIPNAKVAETCVVGFQLN